MARPLIPRLSAWTGPVLLVAVIGCGEGPTGPEAFPPVTLSAGGTFTCRLDGGAAECWGTNWWGQLGADTEERCDLNGPCARTPVRVAQTLRFSTIEASTASSVWSGHVCGVTTDHAIYCWGVDKTQLGVEQTAPEYCVSIDGLVGQPCSRVPVRVDIDLEFIAVASGNFHTCGLTSAGRAFCWGSDDNGQLGTDAAERCGEFDLPCSFEPVEAESSVDFVSLVAGALHTCGLSAAGGVYCWGNNDRGQLGHTAPFGRHVPFRVSGQRQFTAITAGEAHTCGLTADRAAFCWGSNASGQLGNGATVETAPQTRVKGAARFTSLSAGWTHSCGLAETGDVYCWGSATFGQLGSEAGEDTRCADGGACRVEPVRVEAGFPFTTVTAGGVHTCGLSTDGETYCWGDNSLGQLGTGEGPPSGFPVRVGS